MPGYTTQPKHRRIIASPPGVYRLVGANYTNIIEAPKLARATQNLQNVQELFLIIVLSSST